MSEFEKIIYETCQEKFTKKYTWQEVADIINTKTGYDYSEATYRRLYKKLINADDNLLEIKKEKVKLSDERTQLNAYVRRLAREETLKEIASEAVKEMSKTKILQPYPVRASQVPNSKLEALLELSDWHYGIECNNHSNTYNPEISKRRVSELLDKVIGYCTAYNVQKIHIVNLADLIAGRIHLTLRLESRIDVITQIMEVSEMLAEFIYSIATALNIPIEYYECSDNHSRVEPNKKDSLELESLYRLTSWYLKERLKFLEGQIHFNENKFGEDIISFKIFDWNIAGVHGHKDSPSKVVDNLSMFTRTPYDLICASHFHHFSCDEKNECVVVSNGSLMGTDTYAKDLRLNSKPSQNLIIVSPTNVIEGIHRIVLHS